MPDFASPFRKGEKRPPPMEEVRTGEELIPAAERRRRAAIRDPVLALKPKAVPFFGNKRDYVPLGDPPKVSPVFLVSPLFRDKMKDSPHKSFFTNHYFAGHNQPIQHSQWPIIDTMV